MTSPADVMAWMRLGHLRSGASTITLLASDHRPAQDADTGWTSGSPVSRFFW